MIVTTSPTESIAYIIGWWQYDFVWAIMRLFLSQKVHSSDVTPVK